MKPHKKLLTTWLVLSFCTQIFAANIETYTDAPDDTWLNKTITFTTPKNLSKIWVNKNEELLINPDKTEVFIKKDKSNNLNKFNILLNYNLYLNNTLKEMPLTIYMQCPVSKTTYVKKTDELTTEIVKGQVVTTQDEGSTKVIKEEILDPGFYSFDYAPNIKKPLISSEKNTENLYFEDQLVMICQDIYIKYARKFLDEHNRNITLKNFELEQ